MTDADGCAVVRELASEVVLGVAAAQERTQVIDHVAGCTECRTYVAELSGVADDLLVLTPSAEPPSGFESAVLARLREHSGPPVVEAPVGERRRPLFSARRRVATLAAVVALIAALSGGAVHWANRADRALATQVRQTLATADGQYFVAFPLHDAQAERRGSVFAYQGDPPWVLLTVDEPLPPGRRRVELVTKDGMMYRLTDDLDLSSEPLWSAGLPVAVHDAVLLRVVDHDGRLVLSARLTRS